MSAEDEDPYLEGKTNVWKFTVVLGTLCNDDFFEGASGEAPDLLGGAVFGQSHPQINDGNRFNESGNSNTMFQSVSNQWPPNSLVLPGVHAPPSTPAEQSSTSSSDSGGSASGTGKLMLNKCLTAFKKMSWIFPPS